MEEVAEFPCHEAFSRIHDYVDRELAPVEMVRVALHLERCAMCAREFKFEAATLADLKRKVRRIAVPAGLRERVLASLHAED